MPGTRKLGRPSDHRKAMLRGMVTFLLENGKIETTVTRAKEVRAEAEKMITLANKNDAEVASGVLKAIGGKANVSSVDYCATRLRFTIKDYTQVDEKAVKAAGAAGVIRPDKTTCQVIIGTKVQFVYDELKKML